MSTVNIANVGELKGLLAASRSMGMTVVILKIPVRLFAIDPRYQTSNRTERDLNYLIRNWDERKLLPLIGVPHDEEGLMYIVDGFGRYKASQYIDPERYESLDVMVILNAPKDPAERLRFEAEQYAYQNRDVAKMRPIQKHGGMEILDDPAVKALDEMKEKYGFKFATTTGQRGEAVLGSYAKTLDIIRMRGRGCINWIFEVCREAGFGRKANGYSSYVMVALRDMWTLYEDDRDEIRRFLGQELRKMEPITLKANAVSTYPLLSVNLATSQYVEDMVTASLAVNHVRKVYGNRVVSIA